MEGKIDKYSIRAWRENKKEKKNANKREYYKNNQEKLAEKAKERMKRLREKRKLQGKTSLKGHGEVTTRGSSKERNSWEKRVGQVRAKKIERKRDEQREELRKEQTRRQTRDPVRKYREKRKLADDIRLETEGESKGQGHPHPSQITQEKSRAGRNSGKQPKYKINVGEARVSAVFLGQERCGGNEECCD